MHIFGFYEEIKKGNKLYAIKLNIIKNSRND
jgi:hypothetical protein